MQASVLLVLAKNAHRLRKLAAAMIQAQIYREWGVAIVKGRADCLLALLECTVPNASPRSKVACGK